MNKSFIKKMKARLLDEKKAIITKMTYGDMTIDSDGDEADEIQANLLLYLNDQMSSRYKSSIEKINNALSKIDKEEYGYCETCEEEIFEKRLEFNPYFSNCVSCAEKKERHSKR
jgi:DnaK suppressor protein